LAADSLVLELAKKGQIATQYVDLDGKPTTDVQYNPNNSAFSVEGLTSPDGRIFGKMGHTERIGRGLYQNVPGNYDMGLFRSAVKYFK
jgi:phosphoribosylformylglycinamidine synthase